MDDLANHELPGRARPEKPPVDAENDPDLPAILEEVKIEEISIDGMCGVY